mgnify:CR=1 FL=1
MLNAPRCFSMKHRGAFHLQHVIRGAELILSAVIQRERSLLSAVIQRERQRPKNPPVGSAGETIRVLQLRGHSRALLPPSRTRTQRSGSRTKRRSKGARGAFAVRRKRSRADFATTQSPKSCCHSEPATAGEESPKWFLHANDTHSSKSAVIQRERSDRRIPLLVPPR